MKLKWMNIKYPIFSWYNHRLYRIYNWLYDHRRKIHSELLRINEQNYQDSLKEGEKNK